MFYVSCLCYILSQDNSIEGPMSDANEENLAEELFQLLSDPKFVQQQVQNVIELDWQLGIPVMQSDANGIYELRPDGCKIYQDKLSPLDKDKRLLNKDELVMVKDWKNLSPQQIGAYAEYLAKMEFTSHGWPVFTSEVDDHGIDFVAAPKNSNNYFEVQVKSVYKGNYVFIPKEKMCHDLVKDPLPKNRLVCLLLFVDEQDPSIYIIRAPEWIKSNDLLKNRDYDKPGQTSKPEWGINLSSKGKELLNAYRFDDVIASLE